MTTENQTQFGKRTYLDRISKILAEQREYRKTHHNRKPESAENSGFYTVVLVGFPPRIYAGVRSVWRKALKTALRICKKRWGIEYILIFEISPKGHDHAHLILTRISLGSRKGVKELRRVDTHDLNLLRTEFFRIIQKYREEASAYQAKKWTQKAIYKQIKEVGMDPIKIFKVSRIFQKSGKQFSSGSGNAFFRYLYVKPEMINENSSISSGLISLGKSL